MSSSDLRPIPPSKSLPTIDGATNPDPQDPTTDAAENTSSPSAEHSKMNIFLLPTNRLIGLEHFGRGDADDPKLPELTKSIQKHGLINPITVIPSGGEYTVVAGSRRLAAVRQLAWELVDCHVLSSPADDAAYAITGIENLHRQQLNALDEAKYCNDAAAIYDDLDDFAASIGRSVSWVKTRLDLLAWPDDCLAALVSGPLSRSAIAPLAAIPDAASRQFYLGQAQANGATARQTSAWAAQATTPTTDTHPDRTLDTDAPQADTSPKRPPKIPCFVCTDPTPASDLHHLSVCPACLASLHEIRRNITNPEPDQPQPAGD